MGDFNQASDGSGSAIADNLANPNNLGSSQGGQQIDYNEVIAGLERKLGTQGKELGELRGFIDNISPLLGELDKSPDMVKAILEGKVDDTLAKAAIDGRISVTDAQAINQAHTEVQKELGKKGYNAASTDDIAKLVEERVGAVRQELREVEEARAFESSVNDFIARTPDFADHAKEINEWLDEHDVTDISVAYYAVKGQMSERQARKAAEANAGEMAKNMAMNAGGGGSRSTHIPEGSSIIDDLIGGRGNPNVI